MNNPSPSNNDNWSEYYGIVKDMPPRPLLVQAIEYVHNKDKAVDIGGGPLKEARYLLTKGFDVTVIDKSPLLLEEAKKIHSDKLHAHVTSFEDFSFGNQQYDIVSAMFALPFNPPETFDRVFENIKQSIAPDGIFCGQFFGTNDEWASNDKMTFHAKQQVENLLAGMEIIKLDEEEKDGKTANGTPKHWHIFHVIARKSR